MQDNETLQAIEADFARLRQESRYGSDGHTPWGAAAHFELTKVIARLLFLLVRHFIGPAPAGYTTREEKAWRTDWVTCPICDGTDMRREWFSEDDGPYISCVNTMCPSNIAKES